MRDTGRIVVLIGGVGGAKFIEGLAQVVPADRITAVVNTGDDFTHLGLRISPDIDTVTYTLAGLADPEKGWGRVDETWNFMAALTTLGGETWFGLGDRDLALHVERTRRLAAGESLSAITAQVSEALGVATHIVPMSDDPVMTRVLSDEGDLAFQDYFVARRCAPRVSGLRFDGAATARPSEGALAALAHPDLAAVFVAPSNPWLSLGPILALGALREALSQTQAPVVAVTPLPGGRAVKGPTAKIMQELGIPLSAQSIVDHYSGLIDAILIDTADPEVSIPHARTDTIMKDLTGKIRVAEAALALAAGSVRRTVAP